MAAVDRRAEAPALIGVAREARVHTREGTESRVVVIPLPRLEESAAEPLAGELRERFGPDALDCVVLEHPVSLRAGGWEANNRDHTRALLSAWRVLEQLPALGVTREIGVAHAGEAVIALLFEHASVPPAVNQVELHPYLYDAALLRVCAERGVAVHALEWLGPREATSGHLALAHPSVLKVAAAHDRPAEQVVARWGLERAAGLVDDGVHEDALAALHAGEGLELTLDELALLDGLDCGYRIDRSPSTLASIYGNLAAEPIHVEKVDTASLEVGCHKVLYAPVSGSEAFNRGFSYFVWRNVFNLPATARYAVRRRKPSPVAARIRADLDRDGFAVTSVGELGCEDAFERVRAEAAELVGQVLEKENGRRPTYRYKAAGGQEFAVLPDLRSAIDAYFGLETIVDDVSLITIPARLEDPRKQQLWHSDVEDLYTIKSYTFLTDVDSLSGPLEYVAESHPKGRFALETAQLWKYSFVKDPTPAHSFQVPDEMLFRFVRPDLLRTLAGPAGTVVVFDARGLHRGGHVLHGVRQVAVTSHIAPNQAHPWGERTSLWNRLMARFRWETNVTLRGSAS